VIDKGIPSTGLLAHVLIAKYLDHLPLYRQEGIFGRAGLPIPQSTLAEWVGRMGVTLQPLVDALKAEMLIYPVLHADETPVAMLDPGAGKTHRAYLWSYSIGAFEPVKAVIYDFAESRAGKHAREFLGSWRGTLLCDDYAGYKALIAEGVTEAGCMAHARRKFFDLHANNQSQIAQQALTTIQKLYQVEREVAEFDPDERRRIRQAQAKPILDEFHDWLTRHRIQVPNGSRVIALKCHLFWPEPSPA
jgi:transposase